MAEEPTDLQLLRIEATAIDNVTPQLKDIAEQCKKTGRTFEETQRLIDKLTRSFTKGLDKAKKDEQAARTGFIKSRNEILKKVKADFKAQEDAAKKNSKTFKDLIGDSAKVGKAFAAIWSGNSAIKKIYTYVSAIAKVNWQLRQLSVSSGMGIAALSAYGSAAKMYGGSEQSVAQWNTSFNTTIANARRGHGLGNLQQMAMEYGMGIDLFGNAEDNFQSLIKQARGLSKQDQMALAEKMGPRKNEMLQALSISDEEHQKNLSYAKGVSEYQGADGNNRLETAAELSKEFAKETNELAMNWKAIKDEIGNALLPLINTVVSCVKKIAEFLNKHPMLLRSISLIVGAIAAGFALWTFLGAIKQTWSLLKNLGSVLTVEKLITKEKAKQAALNAASGGGGGIPGGGGGGGGLLGRAKGFLNTPVSGIWSKGAGLGGNLLRAGGSIAAVAAAGYAGWKVGKWLDKNVLDADFGSWALGEKGWKRKADRERRELAKEQIDTARNFAKQWAGETGAEKKMRAEGKSEEEIQAMKDKMIGAQVKRMEANAKVLGTKLDWSKEAANIGISMEHMNKIRGKGGVSNDNRNITVVQKFVDSKDKANDSKKGLNAVDKANLTGPRVNSRT